MRVASKMSVAKGGDGAWSAQDEINRELYRAVNSISLGVPADGARAENIDAVWLVYTTNATPDTDDVKRHKLGRVPVGFFQAERPLRTGETPSAGRVYWGTGPSANADTATFRCDDSSKTVYILLF